MLSAGKKLSFGGRCNYFYNDYTKQKQRYVFANLYAWYNIKPKKLDVKFSMFNLLNTNATYAGAATTALTRYVTTQLLPRYALIEFIYKFWTGFLSSDILHQNKWQHILQLYNQLILVEYSPITPLNRTFAFAKVYGHDKAITEAEKLQLAGNNYYHELLGYLYDDIDIDTAISHYEQAVQLTKSKIEKQTLTKEIERLTEKKNNH